MNLRKSILRVFTTNVIQLLSNVIVGFVVPSILSVSGYANLKTYALYLSYIGILHFGFVDGIFIKYGGKSKDEIDLEILKGEHNFLVILESIVTVLFMFISFIGKDVVTFLFGLTILPYMIQSFHRYLFQAIGEFDKYSLIMNIYTVSYAVINIILAIVFKSSDYVWYCLSTLIANFLALLIFEISFYKLTFFIKPKVTSDCFKTMKIGLFIMVGNLAVMGLFGLDKWFIKLFFSQKSFAYYSFAVSMLNIVNILVNAISITFYNFLFRNNSKEKINQLKENLLVLGCFSSMAYFPIAMIVNIFLFKYTPSLNIISTSFSIFPYMITLNALYVNLYKVNKNEKKYLKVVVEMLIISIIYNLVAVFLSSTVGVAFATLLTLITWYIYSSFDLENVNIDRNMFIYPILLSTTFLVTARFSNVCIGFVSYFVLFVALTLLFYRNVLKSLLGMFLKDIR